ncbi:hypothetical protein AAKU55_005770 [Oxalobacteraceae bacterium GrIS 1.11]
MIGHCTAGVVLASCVWGVLDRRFQTRTAGTLALSFLGILALANFL